MSYPVNTNLNSAEREQLRQLFLGGAQAERVAHLQALIRLHATNPPAVEAERDLRDLLRAIAIVVEES